MEIVIYDLMALWKSQKEEVPPLFSYIFICVFRRSIFVFVSFSAINIVLNNDFSSAKVLESRKCLVFH